MVIRQNINKVLLPGLAIENTYCSLENLINIWQKLSYSMTLFSKLLIFIKQILAPMPYFLYTIPDHSIWNPCLWSIQFRSKCFVASLAAGSFMALVLIYSDSYTTLTVHEDDSFFPRQSLPAPLIIRLVWPMSCLGKLYHMILDLLHNFCM